MSIASIVCVDGELDVHDSASVAVAAAIERRREHPAARIGIAVGDLELGDPLGLATRLVALAPPGTILVSDQVRRIAEREGHAFVDLGALSTSGYLDRVHVFELDGATSRECTVLALEIVPRGFVLTGDQKEEDVLAQQYAQLLVYDRAVWGLASAHRGLIARTQAGEHLIAFAAPLDAVRAALALDAAHTSDGPWSTLGKLRFGLERGVSTYIGGHWVGQLWRTAERIRSHRERHLGASMALVDAIGQPALRELGLVIEVVEEVVQKGVRHRVRVAHLRIT